MITINIEDENNVEIQDDNLHLLNFDSANVVKKVTKNANETEISTILNENGSAYAEKVDGEDSYRIDLTKNGLMATKTTQQGTTTSRIATLDDIGDAENDVIEGYLYNGAFYKDAQHTNLITGFTGKIYVDLPTNFEYRFSNNVYTPLTIDTSNLQSKITVNNKLSADLVDDTSTNNKFVTTEQISKIAEINNKVDKTQLATKIQSGLVYMWEDAEEIHIWNIDPMQANYTENNGVYDIRTINYTENNGIYNIGDNE